MTPPDWANVVAVIAAGAGIATAAGQLLRSASKQYTAELGAVKIELESAEELSRQAEQTQHQELDRMIDQLLSELDQESTQEKELAEQVSEVVRAEISKHRQAIEQRTETILSEKYHQQGLAQSNLAFQLSLVFAGLGFLIIAASVIVVLATNRVSSGVVSIISGTIVEAVSALFFVQANQARKLMVQFFDRLRVDRSLEEALKLSMAVPDTTIQSRLSTLLSIRLARADATDDVLRTIMNASAVTQDLQGPIQSTPDG